MGEDELVLFAEEHRGSLPAGFDAAAQELTVLLQTGAEIDLLDRGSRAPLNQRIRRAVIIELRAFLCTTDKRYAEVRRHGTALSRTSLASMSAYVAGAVGISAGVATACVAFVALAVTNISIGTFCQLTADDRPAVESKKRRAK